MEIFDVFSMNGIENYPAAGEFFLENVILKVSQTHTFFKGGNAPSPRPSRGGGGCEVPWLKLYIINSFKIAEEERLAIYKNFTVDSVTS